MGDTYYCLNKLSNLENNVKYLFDSFSDVEIQLVKDIIQTTFKHSYANNKIINNKLFDAMNNIIQKQNLKIENGVIVFPTFSIISHSSNESKIFSSFLKKIHSYLSNSVSNITQFKDVFDLINKAELKNRIIIESEKEEKNEVLIAEKRDVFLKDVVLKDYVIADQNAIQFSDKEIKNIDTIRNKQIIGNKQDQITESEVELLIDVADTKDIIKDIENSQLNN